MAAARPQIDSHRFPAFEILQPQHVRLRQIVHVNVIAHTSSVRRRVFVAKDFERWALAVDGLEGRGDEVSLRLMYLADRAAFVCASGVEITQTYIAQTVGWSVRLQRLFEKQFGHVVWIYRVRWTFFGDRHISLYYVLYRARVT